MTESISDEELAKYDEWVAGRKPDVDVFLTAETYNLLRERIRRADELAKIVHRFTNRADLGIYGDSAVAMFDAVCDALAAYKGESRSISDKVLAGLDRRTQKCRKMFVMQRDLYERIRHRMRVAEFNLDEKAKAEALKKSIVALSKHVERVEREKA